jgi:hypothetical protein
MTYIFIHLLFVHSFLEQVYIELDDNQVPVAEAMNQVAIVDNNHSDDEGSSSFDIDDDDDLMSDEKEEQVPLVPIAHYPPASHRDDYFNNIIQEAETSVHNTLMEGQQLLASLSRAKLPKRAAEEAAATDRPSLQKVQEMVKEGERMKRNKK